MFVASLLLLSFASLAAADNCKSLSVDFVIKANDPEMELVEDNIRAELEKIGMTVNKIPLGDDEYAAVEKNGDYNIFFTRTWGAPYDPHTYLNSWQVDSHVEYSAALGLKEPVSREKLFARITDVQGELNEITRQEKWTGILQDIHAQAMFMPLWGTRVPYVINRRLTGFTPSAQTYEYPIQDIVPRPNTSPNVTIAVGDGGSPFESTGPLTPHSYGSSLFAQAWVYEGLVEYKDNGDLVGKLAETWTEAPLGNGQRVTFQLRKNVKFHDGTDFNCQAAKLNFDHVLSPAGKIRHSWMDAVKVIQNWYCEGENFVIETNKPFYPLLQELSYIRPLAFASPASFSQGPDSDPLMHSTCINDKKMEAQGATCTGLTAPIGTGPFKFVSRTPHPNDPSNDLTVTFESNKEYWGDVPAIDFVDLQYYNVTANPNVVANALKDGSLDMSLGIGPLTPKQVYDFDQQSDVVDVRYSNVLQHALLVLNTAKEPTDDKTVREAIIHAIDKNRIIQEEFAGLERPVTQLLPNTAPYCDVDLTPKWAYDFEKARLLNCPEPSGLSGGGKFGVAVAVVAAIGLAAGMWHIINREKQGKPIFMPPKDEKEIEIA